MNTDELKPGYERVFTVTNYFDGPRAGIANYHGLPYCYACIFDEEKDEYSELFRLAPIDADIFQLALEDWNIWRRWETAYHTGQTNIATHPALPQEAARHAELKAILDKSLVTNTAKSLERIAQFEALGGSNLPKGVGRSLQVKWIEP